MPNPDGSETEQERQARQIAQSHGAYMNPAAPVTGPTTDRVKAGMVAPATGGGVAGDMARAVQDQTAAALTAGKDALASAPGAKTSDLSADRQRYLSAYDEWMNQQRQNGVTPAPAVSANIDDGQGQQIRGDQVDYLGALKARAAGQAPSVAEAQMHQGISAAARSSLGMAAQARGADAAAARRQAILGNADAGARASGDAALLRATEQTQAQQLYGNALSGVRGQDTGLALERGQLGLQADTTNAANSLNAQSLEIGRQTGLRGSALQAGGQATGAALSAEDLALKYKELAQQKDLAPHQPNWFERDVLPIIGGFTGGAGAQASKVALA